MNDGCTNARNRGFALIGLGWLLVALFIGETRLLATLPGPAPQVTVWALTALLLLCGWKHAALRGWIDGLPLKLLIAVHLSRFVGIYFLWLHGRGELPASFAIPAGWGDIAAAGLAAGLLVLPRLESRKGVLLAWNAFGLADILMVLSSGMRISGADRLQVMEMLTQLPLSFLPTMVVPLIIATHVLILVRLWQNRKSKEPGGELSAPARLNPA